jgi:glutathione S-transferase
MEGKLPAYLPKVPVCRAGTAASVDSRPGFTDGSRSCPEPDPMKLYHFPAAPNPARVLFYVREKGIDLELVLVDFIRGEQRSAGFLEKNPAGVLPVLELDDGTLVTESLAIIELLEELNPEPPMLGQDPVTRARTRAMERFIELNVLLRVIRAVHATNSPLGMPPDPALAAHELARLPAALTRVNEHIGSSEFVMGERPSIADCTLLAAMNFARFGELALDPGLTHLHSWFERYALRHL